MRSLDAGILHIRGCRSTSYALRCQPCRLCCPYQRSIAMRSPSPEGTEVAGRRPRCVRPFLPLLAVLLDTVAPTLARRLIAGRIGECRRGLAVAGIARRKFEFSLSVAESTCPPPPPLPPAHPVRLPDERHFRARANLLRGRLTSRFFFFYKKIDVDRESNKDGDSGSIRGGEADLSIRRAARAEVGGVGGGGGGGRYCAVKTQRRYASRLYRVLSRRAR